MCEIFGLLEQMEVEDKGLTRRIEDKLATPTMFAGSDEQRVLRMVIDSVVGDGCIRRGRLRTEPLGETDFLGDDDDDPAVIADREERKEILIDALSRAIDSLPARGQAIVTKVFWENMAQADVARSENRARQRVHDDLERAVKDIADRIGHLRDLYASR